MPCIVIIPSAVSFFASGMTKNGAPSWATTTTWVDITGWTADTTNYPGSSVTSDKLDVQGSKSGATVTASIAYNSGFFNRTHTVRLVDQSGNVIATGTGNTANAGSATVTASGVDLAGITRIGVQMNSSGDSAGTIASGSTSYLTIT